MARNGSLRCIFAVVCLLAALAPASVPAQVCGPLDDGRLADAFYEGTVIFWEPLVEYREMVLTIGGPCEDIVKVFGKGEPISFDIREITKVTDGTYTWQLRRAASIDPGVQKDLEASRGTGEEDAVWWSYFQKGAIPEGPYVESASFTVERGLIIDPNQVEEKRATVASRARGAGSTLAAGLTSDSSDGKGEGNVLGTKDHVIPDDLIVQGSACVGFDCVNGESFGFDTIRMKENNTRIQFNDTSVGSFPTGNWQIRANSSSSGGQSFLGFVDQGANDTSETGTLVFAVEAGARANALYVESDGDVGLGTSNPVLDFHISSTNTPGLRLEQTSAGGFTAQTWDIAGNEANFFVRDVTGGSRLPFRIRPDAPTSSIDIASDGDVGIGTASPDTRLHVKVAKGEARIEATSATGSDHASLFLEQSGAANTSEWEFRANATTGALEIRDVGSAGSALKFQETAANNSLVVAAAAGGFARVGIGTPTPGGNAGDNSLDVNGAIFQRGAQLHADYVFEPGYELESIEEHAGFMWENKHLPAVPARKVDETGREVIELGSHNRGIVEELEKAHIYIEQLNGTIQELKAEAGNKDDTLIALQERLTRLEVALAEAE